MRTLFTGIVALALTAMTALAADVTGKWTVESKMRTPDGQERTMTSSMELKSSGETVTGTVTQAGRGGGEPRTIEIKEGKLVGNKLTFKTVTETPNGSMTQVWEGTVDGSTITGKRMREGGDASRAQEFTAKKQ